MPPRMPRSWFVGLLVLITLGGAPFRAENPSAPEAATNASAEARPRWQTPTESKRWRVTLTLEAERIELGRFQTWQFDIRDARGQVVTEPLRIAVDGGMDAHGHGLPTRPQVSGPIEPGRYRIEGLKFTMAGAWQLRFELTGARARERAELELQVEP